MKYYARFMDKNGKPFGCGNDGGFVASYSSLNTMAVNAREVASRSRFRKEIKSIEIYPFSFTDNVSIIEKINFDFERYQQYRKEYPY